MWRPTNHPSYSIYFIRAVYFLELLYLYVGKMEVRFELDCSEAAAGMGKDGDVGGEGLTSSLTLQGKVVAKGYYGRPHELEDSASKFLCVKACVMEENGSLIGPIEFVVDTLSESVTLTTEHFKNCKKKFLTRKTIHGPNSISYEDNIYTGSVVFGKHIFEIEVSSRHVSPVMCSRCISIYISSNMLHIISTML